MFDWISELFSGISDAFSSAIQWLWKQISDGIFDIFFKWLYKLVFNAIADFFSMIGNMGTELFDLPWVQAVLKLFQYFGWALFAAGLIVAVFDTAIEYQSMERINIKRQVLPFLYGFLAVNLFTVVPIRLYCLCITIQNTLMHDLSELFAGSQGTGNNLGSVARSALNLLAPMAGPVGGGIALGGTLLNLLFVIALGYCVIKVFFANIKRGGVLLTQVAVGSLYMFSIPKGNTEGFIQWCRQVIALCITAFLQMTLLYLGLLTFKSSMLLGLGVMLAANEVPNIARQFGLDTSVKVHMASAIHNTTMAMNMIKAVGRR
jgi:hypothetical protein